MEKWVGKFAVVTGASSGIGRATARQLFLNGINVIGLDKVIENFVQASELTSSNVQFVLKQCDVSNSESLKSTFKWIEDQFGAISILVNCAGIARNVNILDEDESATEKLNEVINTNFTGLVHCTREAVKLMRKTSDFGIIVNICSILGLSVPFSDQMRIVNVYPSSKHAVKAFSQVLRHEILREEDNKIIKVTNISPGAVDTNIKSSGGFDTVTRGRRPRLMPANVAQAIALLMELPLEVEVTELTIQPFGERF